MTVPRVGRLGASLVPRLRVLLSERLAPVEAAAAVSLGIALGIIPIYGVQSLTAVALASVLHLNRPLTLGATFINNPLLQPLLVLGSLELGHRALHGEWMAVSASGLSAGGLKGQLGAFVLGSVVLAAILAPACGGLTYLTVSWRARRRKSPVTSELRRRFRAEVDGRYAGAPSKDRRFIWWKARLDRIFDVLLLEDLGKGRAVDLGCGYGLALLAAAVKEPGRPVSGCDLDGGRVAAARQALSWPGCRLSVADAAVFEIEPAGLILIIDVLQYFDRDGQASLLSRCARALEPGGRLIFRVPETRPGWTTPITRWLDLAIFRLTGTRLRPTCLAASDYRRWLEDLGLSVSERHLRNRLPLSHVLFVSRRPEAQADA